MTHQDINDLSNQHDDSYIFGLRLRPGGLAWVSELGRQGGHHSFIFCYHQGLVVENAWAGKASGLAQAGNHGGLRGVESLEGT